MIGDIVVLVVFVGIFWPLLYIPLFILIAIGAFIQDVWNRLHGRRYDAFAQEYVTMEEWEYRYVTATLENEEDE